MIIDNIDMLPENLRAQAREKLGEKKPKYRNTKTEINGIKFDSEKEAKRYLVLKDELDNGKITELKLQHAFTLLEPYITPTGEKVGKISYIADFTYMRDGEFVVEDVKSRATKNLSTYRIKKKLMSNKGYIIHEV